MRTMTDKTQRAMRLVLLSMVVSIAACALWAAPPAHAEDEDTSSSVYLVFDPETGEFITMDDPDAALPNQTGLEPGAAPSSSQAPAGHAADEPPGGDARLPVIGLSGLIVLIVLGAFVLIYKRRRAA